jgi:uncharacterized protein
MKIGVISDTHGNISAVRKAFGILEDAEVIMHAGDIFSHGASSYSIGNYNSKDLSQYLNSQDRQMMVSKGNCDRPSDQQSLLFDILRPYVLYAHSGYCLLMLHGDDGNMQRLADLIMQNNVNIVISGHTHVFRAVLNEKILYLNPGSPSLPRSSNPPSAAVIDLDACVARIINVEDATILMEINLPMVKGDLSKRL